MTGPGWETLAAAVAAQASWLRPPLPQGAGVCAACRGPARGDYLHCFHCGLHAESVPGLLADSVVPISYAVKGSKLAGNLWMYKSPLAGAASARAALAALLLMFLRDHGGCAWRLGAGAPVRPPVRPPTHLAVVPSTRGRPGPHPLQAMMRPFFRLPWAHLATRQGPEPPDPDDRDLSLDLFRVTRRLPRRARVLLLDDTWTTGSRCQSAAATLKLAGAARVVAIVLGRHLAEEGPEPFGRLLRDRHYGVSADGLRPCPMS